MNLAARSLLTLHEGACSVPIYSPLVRAFRKMEKAGEVKIELSSTPDFLNIRTIKKP